MTKKYRCRFLNHGLFISFDHFRHCHLSFHAHEARFENKIMDYSGPEQKVNWDEVFAIKRKLSDRMGKGDIPAFCKGCSWIEEIDEKDFNYNEKDYIDIIWFAHFNTCNSRCCYCYINDTDDVIKGFDVAPLLQSLFDKGLYDTENGDISFGFGEPSLLPSFGNIIDVFHKHGVTKFAIYTNAIKYSDVIGNALKAQDMGMYVVVSIDSGTRETFKKIKTVDKFNDVCTNIKKYVNCAAKKDIKQLQVKFIVIPSLNDTKEEVLAWYELCTKKLGVKSLAFDVEEHWYLANKDNIPQYIIDFCKYVRDRAIQDGIDLTFFDRAAIFNLD